jgi:SAM-dependent methyltransferase
MRLARFRRSRLARAIAERMPEPIREAAKDAIIRWPKPVWGTLRRTEPLGRAWGFDRGTPVDRVLIEAFLGEHAGDIRGRVLEVGDSRYTRRFGGSGVAEAAVLDVNAANPAATLVADLGRRNALPEARFDCVIMTQVLQYVGDVSAALANVARSLAPGGVALITVPCISPVDVPARAPDLRRWTAAGLERELREACPDLDATVEGRGGLTAAIAFLHGLAGEELRVRELEGGDDRFQLVVCARLAKR